LHPKCLTKRQKIKKNQSELKNTINEMKDELKGINRLEDRKEEISNMEKRAMERTQAEQ